MVGFSSPMNTSAKCSDCQAVVQYWLESKPRMKRLTAQPPVSPTRSEMMTRKNSMAVAAMTRGVTSFLEGSVPRARMASICSVTTMEPSSLAMPEALRPETIRPVSTGPSSRTMESETSCPVSDSEPKRSSVFEVCRASTAPVKKPVSTTMGSEPTPMRSACIMVSAT